MMLIKPIGIVVTFHPDSGVLDRLAAMRRGVEELVVVDNGSGEAVQRLLGDWCNAHQSTLIANPSNEGLAAALNRGTRLLDEKRAEWFVSFDQDSTPSPGMVPAMIAALARCARRDRVAVVGPSIRDRDGVDHRWLCEHPRMPWLFQKRQISSSELQPVTMVITSGSLVRMDVWRQLGGFDEKLFIDGVDTDFCLRARAAGWGVEVASEAVLHHQLGARRRTSLPGALGRPTHHPPLRHYYIARNRIWMFRRHALSQPHWFLFESSAVVLWLFRVVVLEERKWAKLCAMVVGTWDGLRRRSGACLPERRLGFER